MDGGPDRDSAADRHGSARVLADDGCGAVRVGLVDAERFAIARPGGHEAGVAAREDSLVGVVASSERPLGELRIEIDRAAVAAHVDRGARVRRGAVRAAGTAPELEDDA